MINDPPYFLIADDNLANRTLLEHLLKNYGTCVSVKNGLEAINKYKAVAHTDEAFSLIFMDVMMPGMSGTDALLQIRSYETCEGLNPVNVVMVSALRDGDSIQKNRDAGAQHFLVKPFREVALYKLLSTFGFSLMTETS